MLSNSRPKNKVGVVTSDNNDGTYAVHVGGYDANGNSVPYARVPSLLDTPIGASDSVIVGFISDRKDMPIIRDHEYIYRSSPGEVITSSTPGWTRYGYNNQRTRSNNTFKTYKVLDFVKDTAFESVITGFPDILIEDGFIYCSKKISGGNLTVYKKNAVTGNTVWEHEILGSTTNVPYGLSVEEDSVYINYNLSSMYRIRKIQKTDGVQVWDSLAYIGMVVNEYGVYSGTASIRKLNLNTGVQEWNKGNGAYGIAWSNILNSNGSKVFNNSGRYIICRDANNGGVLWATALNDATWEYTIRETAIYGDSIYGFYRIRKKSVTLYDFEEYFKSLVGADFLDASKAVGHPQRYKRYTSWVYGTYLELLGRNQATYGGAFTGGEYIIGALPSTLANQYCTDKNYLFSIDLETGGINWQEEIELSNITQISIDSSGIYCLGTWTKGWYNERAWGSQAPYWTDATPENLGDYQRETDGHTETFVPLYISWSRKYWKAVGVQKRSLSNGSLISNFDLSEYFDDYHSKHDVQLNSLAVYDDLYVSGTQFQSDSSVRYPFLIRMDKTSGSVKKMLTWAVGDFFPTTLGNEISIENNTIYANVNGTNVARIT